MNAHEIVNFPLELWKKNFQEITRSRTLQFYGAVIAFTHVLSLIYFFLEKDIVNILSKDSASICWPIFENCFRFRVFSPRIVLCLLVAYLLWAIATIALFLRPQIVSKTAYVNLLLLTLFKLFLYFQDYRFCLNQEYMIFAISIVFLFFLQKVRLLQYLIVLIYFWAGVLKLNPEWLNGSVIYKLENLWIPPSLHHLAFLYVVILEVCFSFFLLSISSFLFWLVFIQILLFHLFSWPIVGFYYPVLMYSILSIFPLARFLGSTSHLKENTNFLPGYVFLITFSALQIYPYLLPGDKVLTAEGHYLSLHMFDGKTSCSGEVIVEAIDGGKKKYAISFDSGTQINTGDAKKIVFSPRLKCDPLVYYSWAKYLCRQQNTKEVSVFLSSKRSFSKDFRQIVHLEKFCHENITYRLFRHNPWILVANH